MLCGLPRSVREHLLHRDVQPQEVPEELPPADELPRRVRPVLHPPGTRPLHLATAGIDSRADVICRDEKTRPKFCIDAGRIQKFKNGDIT